MTKYKKHLMKMKKVKKKKSSADPFRYFDSKYRLPNNISKMPPNVLREYHSYWAAQYVYSQSMVADREANLRQLQTNRKQLFNESYIKQKRFQLANDYAKAKADSEKGVVKLDHEIDILEIQLIIWRSLTESARTFMYVCSRDQSWRQVEYEHFQQRGGQ